MSCNSLPGPRPRALQSLLPIASATIAARAADSRPTVAEQAALRGGCRVGLVGLAVEFDGRRWRVESSRWGAGQRLLLSLLPDDLADAYLADRRRIEAEVTAGRLVITAAEASEVIGALASAYPGLPRTAPASRCILLDRWPVRCCRPSRARRNGQYSHKTP
ncbi:MAG: hypothetical protein U0800_08510 [Isosphaeraceae bacterium]